MICTTCRRYVTVTDAGLCSTCGAVALRPPYRWSPPKHNNKRAWSRIAKGEWLWDRRRVVRSKRTKGRIRDTVTRFETRTVPVYMCTPDCEDYDCRYRHQVWRTERIPGSQYEAVNQDRLPDVDMGG